MSTFDIESKLADLSAHHEFWAADFPIQIYCYLAVLGKPVRDREIVRFLKQIYRGLSADELFERVRVNLSVNSGGNTALFRSENQKWAINNRALLKRSEILLEFIPPQVKNRSEEAAELKSQGARRASITELKFNDFGEVIAEISELIQTHPKFSSQSKKILFRVWNSSTEFLTLRNLADEFCLLRETVRQQLSKARAQLKKVIFSNSSDPQCQKLKFELIDVQNAAAQASPIWNVTAFEQFLSEHFEGGSGKHFQARKQVIVEMFDLLDFVRLGEQHRQAQNQLWLAPGAAAIGEQIETALEKLRRELKEKISLPLADVVRELKEIYQINLNAKNLRFLPALLLPLKCDFSPNKDALELGDQRTLERLALKRTKEERLRNVIELVKKLLENLKTPLKSTDIYRFLREHEDCSHLSLSKARDILSDSPEFAALGNSGFWCLSKDVEKFAARPKAGSEPKRIKQKKILWNEILTQKQISNLYSYIKPEPNDCWIWHGKFDERSNPFIRIKVKKHFVKVRVREFVYEIENQVRLKSGRRLKLRCNVDQCVNPEHGFIRKISTLKRKELSHCKNGHPYPENIAYSTAKRIVCRACRHERQKRERSVEYSI